MLGYIVVISRNGSLGGRYPLTTSECLFGQSQACDVRVHVSNVARRHCVITATLDGKASLRNLSPANTTMLNGKPIGADSCELEHTDVITVGDRHFRWEYPMTAHTPAAPRMIQGISGGTALGPQATCVVQLYNRSPNPRHSAPSTDASKEASGEPSAKRRKTLGGATDSASSSPPKPINKRLLAVQQPAAYGRRSLQPLRGVRDSASKRKSLIPVKTPNRAKMNNYSPSKSAPLLVKPTTPVSSAKSKTLPKSRPSLAIPLKTKTPKLSKSPTLKVKSLKPLDVEKNKPTMTRKSLGSYLKREGKSDLSSFRKSLPAVVTAKSQSDLPKQGSNSTPVTLTVSSTSMKRLSNQLHIDMNSQCTSTTKTARERQSKTPQAIKSSSNLEKNLNVQSSSRKSSLEKSPSPSRSGSPKKTPRGRQANTPDVKGSSKKGDLDKSPSPSRSVSPTKTPRGRLAKTPDVKGSSKKGDLDKSPSPSRSVSPTKTPRGRPAKTPDVKGSSKKASLDKSPSPSRSVSPTKTPRGRPAKTPDVKGSSKKGDLDKSPSPSRSVSPTKTPRGRPAKTPDVKGPSKKASLEKSPSPSRSVSPTKTPRGRPAKTPDVKGSSKKGDLDKSPSPSRIVSPTKTPRGRPAKTPDVKVSSKKASLERSLPPSRSVSPTKTPRGRPAKTPDVKSSSKKASLEKSPAPSRSVSPTKTPRGRPAKTPDVKGSSKKGDLDKSPSRSVSQTKTPRGRPAKTQDVKSSSKKAASEKSPSPSRSVSTTKTPRGRPAKTPDVKGSSKKASLDKSPSPSRSVSPTKTPRGRPAKTPDVKGFSKKASLDKSPSPPRSVSPTKTPRGRPAKTPDVKGSSKKASLEKSPSPSRSVSPTKTPRGRPAKTPDVKGSSKKASLFKSPSPPRSVSPTKTPRGRPAKTPDVKGSSKKASLEKSPSPSRSVSPTKTPRGRPTKTPDVKGSSKKASLEKSPSPSRSVSPTKTLRGRPAKTPDVKVSSKKASLDKSPSPSRSVSPTKTPRGRPVETPDVKGSSKKASLEKSPSPSRSVSPTKTPRGRPAKTPDVKMSSKKATLERSLSPSRSVSPTKTPRGRPAKTPDIKSSSRKSSSEKSLSPSYRKTPINTPDAEVLFQESSPFINTSPTRTSRGRPSKTPDVNSSSRNTSPMVQFRSVSPTKTPIGTPVVTSDVKSKKPSLTQSLPPSRNISPSTSRATSPHVKSFSRKSTPSEQVLKSTTPKTVEVLHKSSSLSSSINATPIKTPKVRKSLSADRSEKKTSSESLLEPPKSARSLRSEAVSVSLPELSDKSSQLASSSSSAPIMRFTATLKPRHNRASILRTSLHHDSTLLQEMAEMFSGEEGSSAAENTLKTTLRSRLSSSATGVSAKKEDTANLPSGPKRKTEDSDAEARAEKAAKRLKMETPKSLSKNKVAALLACHSRSPKSATKRPLFSEVLKHKLTAAKQRQTAAPAANPVTGLRRTKQKIFEPSLEVPKSFNFNSTGHVNSPETLVIRKTLRSTPEVKPLSGRKSRRGSWAGTQESLKTPKGTVSSLKTATSVKKGQSMKVRFSLHNEVQSPSGKRVSIKQTESPVFLGSPIVLSKRYKRTPRRSRISEASMLHASIKEESPLAQEVSSSELSSFTPTSASKKRARESYDFSIYSPSSPTLQFSQISDVSSQFARKSIDFNDFSPVSDSSESPKRKRSMPSLNNSTQSASSARKFSFAARRSASDNNARLSSSDLFGSTFESSVGKSSRASRISGTSVDTSGIFKMSPNTSQSSVKSSRNASRVLEESISQIPLPPSPYVSGSSIKSETTPSSSSGSGRSTRYSTVDAGDTPKSVTSRRSKSETFSLSDSKIVASESPQGKKRISSTPKPRNSVPSQSPVTSPILSTGKRSIRSQSFTESVNDQSSTPSEIVTCSTPQSTGKKGRKGSTRMTASNYGLLSPETQVPILAVKPSTRKKQVNESVSILTDSVSLPNLSVSQDVSGRSIDQSLAHKVLDSRASTPLVQRNERSTPSSALLRDLSISPSTAGRSKRKSSASTNSLADETTFDFNSALTPKVPRNKFVSPLDENQYDLSNLSGVKRVLNPTANSPVSSYTNLKGVKRLLRTPHPPTPVANYASVEGIKRLFKQSPDANYADIGSLNLLYMSPNETSHMNVKGVRRTPNSSDVAGVEVLFESPKKTVETFIKQSPLKPVGMVPPMSRSSLIVNEEVPVVDLTEPVASSSRTRRKVNQPEETVLASRSLVVDLTEPVASGSRSRRTATQPEETVTTSKSRKTRQVKPNEEALTDEVKGRGTKEVKKVATVDKPPTKGRNTRGRQVEEDDSDVEIVEINPVVASASKGKIVKKSPVLSKRKLVVLDSSEQPEAVAIKRTRGRNVTEEPIPKVIQTKSPKTKKPSKLQDTVSELSQQTELPTKRGGRKLRGNPTSPIKELSPKPVLGKRGKPSKAESTEAHSPPKKAKGGKQADVEVVTSIPEQTTLKEQTKSKGKGKQAKDSAVDIVHLEATTSARAGKAVVKSSPSGKGKPVTPVVAATRSRRGKAVAVSPAKVEKPSSKKPRGPAKKSMKDTTVESPQIESPKLKSRAKRGKTEDVPKSLEKSKPQSPVKSKGRHKKTQSEAVDLTPVKGRGRRVVMSAEIAKVEESTKLKQSVKGKTVTVVKSPEKPNKESPLKTKPKGKRGRAEKIQTQIEMPVEMKTETPIVAKAKGRRSQKVVPKEAEKTISPPKEVKRRGRTNKTEVEEVEIKPEPKKGSKSAKSKPSPKKTAKRKSTTSKRSPVQVKESLPETKPSTSRSARTQQEETPPAAKPSRRVQFKSSIGVLSITPRMPNMRLRDRPVRVSAKQEESSKAAKPTLKTKAVPKAKLKATSNRKSASPKKPSPSPPKRVTRSRK